MFGWFKSHGWGSEWEADWWAQQVSPTTSAGQLSHNSPSGQAEIQLWLIQSPRKTIPSSVVVSLYRYQIDKFPWQEIILIFKLSHDTRYLKIME